MPMPVLVTSTMPKSASWIGPIVRMTASSPPRIALNRVKTLARTIAQIDRLVPPGARLTNPCSTRSATSTSVNPRGSGVVSTAACCTWSSRTAGYRRAARPSPPCGEGTAVRRAVYRRYAIESQVVGGGRCGRRDAVGGGGGAGGAGSGQGSGIVDRHGSRYPRRRTHRGIGSHAPRRVGRHPRLLWIPRSLARSRIIGTGGTGGGRVSRPSPHADVARHDGPGRDDAHTSGPLSPGRRRPAHLHRAGPAGLGWRHERWMAPGSGTLSPGARGRLRADHR